MRGIGVTLQVAQKHINPIPGMLKSKKAINLNACADFFSEVKDRVKTHNGS